MPLTFDKSGAELPPPTAERALLSALTEAFVAVQPKPAALAFLRKTAQILADREERDAVVIRLRKTDRSRYAAEARANAEAVQLFRHMLEGCVARLSELPDD